MADAFRQKVIRTLINEIALLTGGRFEQFGYRMMGVIHPAQWFERGTTVEGAPRGYTVDTSADGASLIAEMSSESDYFQADMDKPKRDLHHAISLHSDAKRIWLLASREATAGETTKCANLATAFMEQNPGLKKVEILDARKIAEHIFDNLEVERIVIALSSYLPSVGRLADENAFSHRIPAYSIYQPRLELEQAIVDRLEESFWVTISGISGIGKTALAAQVAKNLSDYDLVIWHDASNLKNVTELSDIDIRRSGTRHNINSLLRRHRCLLLLDDALLPWDQIAEMECENSKIIITCQTTSDPNTVFVGDLDYDSARALLEIDVSTSCPDKVFQRVYSNIGGYPLLLSALNRLAKQEGWESVNICCDDAARSIEDERHNKVCQRILIRHQEALALELEFIKWCEASRFDPELCAICVSSMAVNNLQKRGFLSATAPGYIRVHDVVYQAVCSVIDVSEQHSLEFRNKLDNYIRTEFENERSVLGRIANIHSHLMKRLLHSDPRPSFVYAVALARTGDTPLELLGDPVITAKTIAAYDQWSGREIEIRAIIEAVEAIYTIMSADQGAEAARTSLQRNIEALELLRTCPAASSRLLRDLKHHYAKMLVRLGKVTEAESEFRTILAEHPDFAAARLQLGRILDKTDRKKDAFKECQTIITQNENPQTPISVPILLEALHLLTRTGTPEALRPYKEVIISCLTDVREMDSALALRLIASVAQKTWFTMPQLVSRMYDTIEWRYVVATSDSERFDWAQAHKAAAKVVNFDDLRRLELLESADENYKSIVEPNSYYIIQHAEALILLEKFDEANDLLDGVPDSEKVAFWWQRKAQALLGLGLADKAIDAINNGLHDLGDQKYKPAFLHVRYLARTSLSDPGAIEDLEMAINSLPPDDKYRKELELELKKRTQPG